VQFFSFLSSTGAFSGGKTLGRLFRFTKSLLYQLSYASIMATAFLFGLLATAYVSERPAILIGEAIFATR